MFKNTAKRPGNRPFAWIVAVGTVSLFSPSPASAHFVLQKPASWWSQDGNGGPQKQGPCGNANSPAEPTGTASGVVTPFVLTPGAPGTIDITVNETIGHPGHYRVALAHTQATLPAEPNVTPAAGDPCASAIIQPATTGATVPAAMGVVLGDNLSPKTTGRTGVQMFSVPIPAGLTCANCTLQVIEFMSSHPLNVPGGCFYHHCANVSIESSAVGGSTGGAAGGRGGNGGAGAGAGTGGGPGASGGTGGLRATGGAPASGGAPGAGSGGAPASGASGGAGAAGTASGGAGVDAGNDAASPSSSSGCSCAFSLARRPAGGTSVALLLLGFGVLTLLRRRRR